MNALSIFNRPPKPVIYEVRLEVDAAIVEDFDNWLIGHVREMLSFPGFQTATVHCGHDPASHRDVRLVVYEVRSKRELDSYLHTHAPRMRKDGVNRFGRQFTASRRIVAASEYSLPDGFTLLFDRQHISGGLPVCANCHQPVPGRFCTHCGQEDRSFMLSLGQLIYDFSGDTFTFDSRFFRTLAPLLFRPGVLTAEYIRGRRQHYLPPVRTYVFISLIFFFFAAVLTDRQFDGVEAEVRRGGEASGAVDKDGLRDLTPEQRAEVDRALDETAGSLGLPEGALQLPDSAKDAEPASADVKAGDDQDGFNISGLGGGDFEERIERGVEAVKDDPKAFVRATLAQIPTMMFVFLPMIALVLKLLYIGSGRYYVEHLIFTLHFHSAVFVLLLLWLLFGELQQAWAPLKNIAGWVTAAVWIYIPIYLYRSLRCVYGQGYWLTSAKYVLLFFAYMIAMTMTFAATVLYTLYQQT